ncbi:MAG: corrinoid protein [Dehalococcoidia bacterium]|jgi:corrinoid protein of di/trimethylamine methyltransferase
MTEADSSILEGLANSVIEMAEKKAVRLCEEALQNNIDPYLAISQGLARGMEVMGQGYEKGTCFVPELLLASDAMYAGMNVLRPHLKVTKDSANYKVVIGVTEGDTHDIGKNLVKIMLEADGFQMIDLGADVPLNRFVETAVAEKADMICLSSLMSTTMLRMADFITMLSEEGVRERFKVMVGGACVSPSFARRIGADGYAPDALAAVRKARALLEAR